MIPLTETTFRRLAQSSPWRFRRLHFTWRPGADLGVDEVEAWLTRPSHLRTREQDGAERTVREEPGVPWLLADDSSGQLVADPGHLVPRGGPPAVLDEHGLVVDRPDDRWSGYDDPMWQTYTWVAMLDPRELSEGTTISSLAETMRHGRRTWWAEMAARADGYEPRCGCCPLLWGEVSERAEGASGGPTWIRSHPDVDYPDEWLVGLDVETGIVVSAEPIGGSRPDAGFTTTIHEVG